MKRVSQTLLGLSAMISMPASIEEFQSCLKGEGNVLDYANSEAYYRGVAPKVRTAFLKLVESKLGKSPKTEKKTTGEGETAKTIEVQVEKDTAFIKRIIAEGVTVETLQPLLQTAFDAVGWDLSSSRSTGPNKKDVDGAQFYANAVANGESTWDRIVTNFETANPGLTIEREEDGSVSADVMAEAVRINRIRTEKLTLI